jgi:hypothetical protein
LKAAYREINQLRRDLKGVRGKERAVEKEVKVPDAIPEAHDSSALEK